MPMAPIAANGLVFIGNAGGDQTGVAGHAYALDAADGHVVWTFDVVPDEPAVRATWANAASYPITGGAFWTSFTLDTEHGVLYLPAGNAAPDFDVEARGGDNCTPTRSSRSTPRPGVCSAITRSSSTTITTGT